MSTSLRIIGIFLIICGIIGGIILITEIDWSSYKIAKTVASNLVTNPYAKADLVIAQSKVTTQLSLGILSIFSGIISGLFFCSIGTIIDLLSKIANNRENLIQSNDTIEHSTES